MPMTAPKRALLAVAVLLILAAAAAGFYLYRMRRPLPPTSAGPPPDVVAELPQNVPVIACVDFAALRRLRNSPLAAALGLAAPAPAADKDYRDFVRDTGFDYARDLDKAAVALWPVSLPGPSGGIGENRMLAVAEGQFDQGKIQAYALRTGKAEIHGPHTIYAIPGNPPTFLEFLSPTRLAIASGTNSENLLPLPDSPARDPEMQARIERVAGAPIFAVARTNRLPNRFYAPFHNSPQLEQLARSIRGMTLAGEPDGDAIQTTLDAESDSIKDALEIATLLDGFRMVGSMALADPNTHGPMTKQQAAFLAALLRRTKVTPQDRWVRLSLNITPAMLAVGSAGHRAH